MSFSILEKHTGAIHQTFRSKTFISNFNLYGRNQFYWVPENGFHSPYSPTQIIFNFTLNTFPHYRKVITNPVKTLEILI